LLGAFLGLKITGNPFGFTAFMGIISLIGIVVRNGIILVDYADELLIKHNYSIKGAAKSAGKRRMRPIFLTSAAAAVGVVPMIVGKSPLWAPLGSVLAVGLIVSMILTLFVVPILYYKFVKKEYPTKNFPSKSDEILYKPIKMNKLKAKFSKLIPFLIFILTFQFTNAQETTYSLNELKQIAIQNNKKVEQAQQNLEAAKAAEASANTLNKPTLNAAMYGIYLDDVPMGLIPNSTLYSSVGITQVLYAGGRLNTGKKMAATAVEIQSSQKKLTDSEVLLAIETTYWQLVNVKEKVELAKKYQNLLNELLTDLTNLYNAGIIYKNDVLQVQVEANQAELNLTTAQDAFTVLKLSLAQQTGLNAAFLNVEETINTENNLIEEISVPEVLYQRPEISMLENAVKIGNLQTNLLKAERKPTLGINLSGSYMYGDNLNSATTENHLTNFTGIASLSIPIFDWGGRKHKVKEQLFKVNAQKIALEETKELIAIEIQQAYLEVNQALKRIEIANKSLNQANENLKLNQDRFSVGTVKGSDVLEAQVLWQQAYSNVIDAHASYQIKKATYQKAIGNLK
jgi:outer membrane protein TolC